MGTVKMLGLVAVMALVGVVGACQQDRTGDYITMGDSRRFEGTIISLRPTTSTMIVSNNAKSVDKLNIVTCKWDVDTQFLLDGKKATLDEIQQYMTVQIVGRMVDEQLVVSEARFSSVLPANVRPAAR